MNSAHLAVPFLIGCEKILLITDGYSEDRKFRIFKNGTSYLLRTFDRQRTSEKEKEFRALEKMHELNVRCSRPLEMGILPDVELAYMLLTFIDGEDAGLALPKLSKSVQYRIGLEAGVELKKINSYLPPERVEPWHERKHAKHERYLKAYLSGTDRKKNDTKIIDFVSNHIFLMKDRPNAFQHDDFHVRNLIVSGESLSGVIDFNRNDWGDPIHEFLKLGHFSSEVSVPFCVGQIRGYLGDEMPDDEFWTLYSLYLAMSYFSFIAWTKHVCPNEMSNTLRILNRVLADQDDFERVVPRWYSEYSSG